MWEFNDMVQLANEILEIKECYGSLIQEMDRLGFTNGIGNHLNLRDYQHEFKWLWVGPVVREGADWVEVEVTVNEAVLYIYDEYYNEIGIVRDLDKELLVQTLKERNIYER